MTTSERIPRRFEIWWVPFTYFDKPGRFKNRPSIVIDFDDETRLVLVTKVTGNTTRQEDGYVILEDWQQEGLLKPSAVRCSQLLRIPRDKLLDERPTGRLTTRDAERVITALQTLHPHLFE